MSNDRRRRKVLTLVEKALQFAERVYGENPGEAVEAVKLAMRLAQKTRTRLPPQLRRKFCRKCGTPFIGPSTLSVRVRTNRATHVVSKCRKCGYIRRYYVRKRRLSVVSSSRS